MTSIASRLNKHFVACAAAGATCIGAVDNTDAAIVWSGIVNINIPYTTTGVYLNVANGATGASPVPGGDVNPWSGTTLNMFTTTAAATALGGVGAHVGTGSTYFNLAAGTLISGASTYGGTGTNTINAGTPLNLSSSNNLVGFRFFHEGLGGIRYGWMRIQLGSALGSAGGPRSIVEYAYEDQDGVGILAGAIPAPGALALIGLAGLVGTRRRRA